MFENLIERIKKNEGYVPNVYKDTLGIDTVGYGFTIKDLELSEDICGTILNILILERAHNVYKEFPWLLEKPMVVQEVVIEMSYQMGVAGISRFRKTLDYLKNDDFVRASEEMLDSKWAMQTPGRAKTLSILVKTAK